MQLMVRARICVALVFAGCVVPCAGQPRHAAAEDVHPQKFAVLVGINKYEHAALNDPQPLQYAEADVVALANVLRAAGYEVELIRGAAATKAVIRSKLELIKRRGNSDGVVVVALSGHGIQLENDEEAYFCPYDAKVREAVRNGSKVLDRNGRPILEPDPASCVRLTEIVELFALAPAGRRVLMADCCRRDPATGRGRGVGSGITPRLLPANTAVLLSCSKGQKSFEDARWQHGAFFFHVLRGLESGHSSIYRLQGYLAESVPAEVRGLPFADTGQDPYFVVNGSRLDLGLPATTVTSSASPAPAGSPGGSLVDFKAATFTNSIGVRLNRIPAGEFLMGSHNADPAAYSDEKPQHRVRITRPFYLGVTEVTQREWEAVMGTRPWAGKSFVQEGNDYPATYVSWNDAVDYCQRLTAKERQEGSIPEGWAYRLPTEAEWEYACRAGSTTVYHFGNDVGLLKEYAWFSENADKVNNEKFAHRVGLKRPNAFGLYDMHGNVWEWCEDVYDAGAYSGRGGVTDDPVVRSGGSRRLCRGGCWFSTAGFARSADRDWIVPSNRVSHLGFRLALSPSG